MKILIPVKDSRPGYQRQKEEPVIITCECGAICKQKGNEIIHIGPCNFKKKEQVKLRKITQEDLPILNKFRWEK